jgi:UDP-N-acetylglucosamine:LPS N-acetylglucosamine transferase
MKRIDIYTIDIGGGHIAPAQALKQQFDIMGYKDLEVHVVNLGIVLKARFMRYIYKLYWDKALRYPPLINAFYQGADNPFLMKIIDRLMSIPILPRFVRYLEEEKPDLVVSTYFTFTHYIELLKRVGQMDAVAVVLNPEPFDSHYVWFSQAFEWSMVFSRKSRDEIVAKGLSPAKVREFPFPIKPSYAKRTESKALLRRRVGIAQKPFTVLFFFGAEGVGPVRKYIAALVEKGLEAQVVVICGKNEKLKSELESLSGRLTGPLALHVRGYVTNVSEYVAAADVVVGKSGPNQVFETLLQNRPLIISSYLANERETSTWVVTNRVGWLTRTPTHLTTLLAKLAGRPSLIREYQANIRRLKLRSGAPEICEFLYGLVSRERVARKRPMADAMRRLREAVRAEGEALSRRIDASQAERKNRRATARHAAEQRRARARRAPKRSSGKTIAASGRARGQASPRRPKSRRGRPTSSP